jgi:large subunit ribosomal protein L9
MEVILLDDVDKLGLRGDVVNVARGYARNFLLPRRLAEPATPAKVAELHRREERRALYEARSVEQAHEMADRLRTTVLRFEVKSGPTGSLFGSVTATQVADELWRTRKVRVDRRKIEMDSIKRIGRYEIPVVLFEDVRVDVKTLVVPEGGELPSEEELQALEAEERAAQEPAPEAAAGEPAFSYDELAGTSGDTLAAAGPAPEVGAVDGVAETEVEGVEGAEPVEPEPVEPVEPEAALEAGEAAEPSEAAEPFEAAEPSEGVLPAPQTPE